MKSTVLPLAKKSKRLVVRPLEIYDFENWRQAYSCQRPPQNEWDETNWRESELTLPKFKSILRRQQQRRAQDKFFEFGIFRLDDGVLIGTVDVMDISRTIFQNAYLGYRIFNNYWGEGYASEASRLAIDIAFKKLKLHRLEAAIGPDNKRSIRVAKALGMRKEGLSARRLYVNKKWQDMLIYALTCEDLRLKFSFLQK